MSQFSAQGLPQNPSVTPRVATRLESVEEIRQAVGAHRPTTRKEETAAADTTPFRPVRRPPMALLCILDDGGLDGQWVRLRGDTLVVGRSEGDITIPHDSMISSRHAELSRRLEGGRTRWHLTDLQSTNGTYVRVGGALLKHNQELLLGSYRYRFVAPGMDVDADEDSETQPPRRTQAWEAVRPEELVPSLVRLAPNAERPPILLGTADNLLGRNPNACSIVIADDPFLSPLHARFCHDSRGRWRVENSKSLNGVWLRIEHMALEAACQFQLGEQRFLLRLL